MAWRQIDDKRLSEPMLTRFIDAYIRRVELIKESYVLTLWCIYDFPDIIKAILFYETDAVSFLKHRKVTSQHLLNYLVRHGQRPDIKAHKSTLINIMLELWGSQATRTTVGLDDVIKWKHFPRHWPLCGEFTGLGEFPSQRSVTRSFDVFFGLRLNIRLSKHFQGW